VHKKVNFTKENEVAETEATKPTATFNLNQTEDAVPAWLSVLRSVHKNS